jgi:leucyl-tRNA synthetase
LFQDSRCVVAPDPGPRATSGEQRLYIRLNQTIRKVTEDLGSLQFNTAIAAIMEFLNDLTAFEDRQSRVFGFALNRLVYLLSPFAPHLAEELWCQIGGKRTILEERFPGFDPGAVSFDQVEIPVQVNGRLRSKLVVARGTAQAEIEKLALADAKVAEFTRGKSIRKVIHIKDRLVNVVV